MCRSVISIYGIRFCAEILGFPYCKIQAECDQRYKMQPSAIFKTLYSSNKTLYPLITLINLMNLQI